MILEINTKAPASAHSQMVIPVKPVRIWTLLSNLTSWHLWFPSAQKLKMTEKKTSPGKDTDFRWQLRSLALHSKIVDFTPPERLSIRSRGSGVRLITVWTTQEQDQGTLVSCQQSMQGLLVRLLRDQTNSALHTLTEDWLACLVKAAQTPSPQIHPTQTTN